MSINQSRFAAIIAEVERVEKYFQVEPAYEFIQARQIKEQARAIAELDTEWLLIRLSDAVLLITCPDAASLEEPLEKTLARYPQFIRDFHARADAILGEFWIEVV